MGYNNHTHVAGIKTRGSKFRLALEKFMCYRPKIHFNRSLLDIGFRIL
jgi:hypothetical protein